MESLCLHDLSARARSPSGETKPTTCYVRYRPERGVSCVVESVVESACFDGQLSRTHPLQRDALASWEAYASSSRAARASARRNLSVYCVTCCTERDALAIVKSMYFVRPCCSYVGTLGVTKPTWYVYRISCLRRGGPVLHRDVLLINWRTRV